MEKRRKTIGLAVGLGVSVWAGLPASGALIEVLNDHGNEVQDFPIAGHLSFDVDWHNNQPIDLRVHLEARDSGLLAFSGIHLNDSDASWDTFRIVLSGGLSWERVNQVRVPDHVGLLGVEIDGLTATLTFDPALLDRDVLILGSPDNILADLTTDWVVRVENFVPGAVFDITVQGDPVGPGPDSGFVPTQSTPAPGGLGVLVLLPLVGRWGRRGRGGDRRGG